MARPSSERHSAYQRQSPWRAFSIRLFPALYGGALRHLREDEAKLNEASHAEDSLCPGGVAPLCAVDLRVTCRDAPLTATSMTCPSSSFCNIPLLGAFAPRESSGLLRWREAILGASQAPPVGSWAIALTHSLLVAAGCRAARRDERQLRLSRQLHG